MASPWSPAEDRRELLDIATQIADGLRVAHAAGFVHRDLKPDSILIPREGRVKILDIGLVQRFATAGDSSAPQSMTIAGPGVIAGTLAYISPEQASGAADLETRSD